MKDWKTWGVILIIFVLLRQCDGCSSRENMMEEAYKSGKDAALYYNYIRDFDSDQCDGHFLDTWGTPKTEADIEVYQEYKREYRRGWEDGKKILRAM